MEENNWSFNAPQYVDFNAPQPIDDEADKWFDSNYDGKPLEDKSCADESLKENVFEGPQIQCKTEKKVLEGKPLSSEDVIEKKKCPANILTPSRWYRCKSENGEKKTSLQQSLASKPASKSAKPSNKPIKAFPLKSPKTNETSNKMVKGNSMTNINRSVKSSDEKGTLKKSLSSSKLKKSSSLRLISRKSEQDLPGRVLRPRGSSTDRLHDQTSNKDNEEQTTLATPTCMKRKHTSVGPSRVIKNSEERELETIETFRKSLAERRKQSDLSLKKIKATSSIGPMKAKVDDSDSTSKSKSKTKGFLDNIKDKFTSSGKEQNAQKKSEKDLAGDKFESMAERVLKFQSGTPDRFRSRPKDKCKVLKRLRSGSPRNTKNTIPYTPNLQCTKRTRKITAPSREELELKEIEEMQKNQFHAQPVNHKIFEQRTGVKEVPKKPTTEVKSFDLTSDKRIKDKEDKKPKEEKYSFHAKPVNPKILEGQVGVKPAKEKPATVPQSPAFTLKNRVRLPVGSPEEKQNTLIASRSVPHHGIPFQPKLVRKITVTQPFSFETRDRENCVKKEAKLQQIAEEEQKEIVRVLRSRPIPHNGVPFQPNLSHKHTIPQPFSFEDQMHQIQERHEAKRRKIFEEERKAREFHAQPMPTLEERVGIPPKQIKEITIPVPFDFEIDGRAYRKGDETSCVSDEDVLPHFKAKPATVIYQKAFKPKKSEKPTTDISEFELNTEKRAAERESFEMHMKHKEASMLALKRQKEQAEEEAAKAEEQRLRMESVHRANPVRHYAPVNICPSGKPLTQPESPLFTDRFKI